MDVLQYMPVSDFCEPLVCVLWIVLVSVLASFQAVYAKRPGNETISVLDPTSPSAHHFQYHAHFSMHYTGSHICVGQKVRERDYDSV